MKRFLLPLSLVALITVACTSRPTPESSDALQAIEPPEVLANATQELSQETEVLHTQEDPAVASSMDAEPKRYTFVLIGGDLHRLGWATDTGTFVIVTGVFPQDKPGDVVVIDVPRDLYVPIPCQDGTLGRIVAAYQIGLDAGDGNEGSGIDCVHQVVEETFGLEVNSGVALVTGDAFEVLIDSFGGLDITPKADYERRCGRSGAFRWIAGEMYQMDGEAVKCYLKLRSNGIDRDQGRAARAGQVVTAMAVQWLPLYVEHPVDSVLNSWRFWKENVDLSLSLGDAIRLAPLIPRAQSADIRSPSLRLGEDVSDWTTPQGVTGLQPLVNLREWAACSIANLSDQELQGCLESVSSLP
jgi:hypothetical protein